MKSVSGKNDERKKLPTRNEIMKDSLYNQSNVDDEQIVLSSKKKYKNWWDIVVVSQDATLYSVFQFIFTFVSIFGSIMYAYFAAFNMYIETKDPEYEDNIFTKKDIEEFKQAELVIEIICLLDFLIQFCMEYKGPDDPLPVREL
jgi:hypothetical protein